MIGQGDIQAWHIGYHTTQWRDQFLEDGFVSLGHPDVDFDFSQFESFSAVKERFEADQNPSVPSSFGTQVWKFATEAEIGDVIVLKEGMRSEQDSGWVGQGRVLALGVITGDYVYAPSSDVYEDTPITGAEAENQHYRQVHWVSNLVESAEGPFQPQVPIQRWGFYSIDYVALKSQLLAKREFKDEFEELGAT
jgi:predicted Mrr-cat superfamily restriction endonuclease